MNGLVAAAYVVFVALIVAYVAVMARRLARIERALREHDERTRGAQR